MKLQAELPLICPHGHTWLSSIIAIDWSGALFKEKFCPECARPGKRLPITSSDLDDLVAAEDLAMAGEDAGPTLAIILSIIFTEGGEEKTARIGVPRVAEAVVDHVSRVEGHIHRLAHMNFLNIEPVQNPELGNPTYNISPGPKIHLIKLVLP